MITFLFTSVSLMSTMCWAGCITDNWNKSWLWSLIIIIVDNNIIIMIIDDKNIVIMITDDNNTIYDHKTQSTHIT